MMINATPSRLRPVREILKPLAWSAAIWGVVLVAMTAAMVADARDKGQEIAALSALGQGALHYIPLVLLSWALHQWFSGPSRQTVGRREVLLALLPTVLIFPPLYILYQALVVTLLRGQPLSGMGTVLAQQSRFGWWTDLLIVIGAFALQVALTTHRLQREQATILLEERNRNLELRLALLQGQLEPHFLFNALNSIAALVRSGDRADALTALATVSDLLRFALRASQRPWVRVTEELAFVDAYLSMQRLRMGARMQIDRRVAGGDWSTLRCPPLLFQPLVENAVKHGVESTTTDTLILLDLSHRGELLHLRIDNPVGAASEGNGLGLGLTRQRLDALYGGRALLETRVEDGMHVTTLIFPAEDMDGNAVHSDR
ncbi:sensor histidine kinase [Niveispirillum cyanobacteriorum]|nr:histidine kinase [Niveispirillum cyanobacteriorum]